MRKFQGAEVPGPIRSGERKFQGARRPGSERARERKFQGANWPASYWPIRSRERIGPGAKRLNLKINRRDTPTAVYSSAYLRVTLAYVDVRPNLHENSTS